MDRALLLLLGILILIRGVAATARAETSAAGFFFGNDKS
jgi:hypothetical protein